MPDIEQEEELVLDTSEAESLAKEYRTADGEPSKPDPCKDIPCSLLSAEHIVEYVQKTGLISPFYTKGGKLSRLKKAAYEGRMGDAAYLYKDDHNPKRVLFPTSNHLTVPANSIVFVECDLEFRLPEFIALRFNLQIQHVHRGLLLGTGPLVDPGFWGKLCIPLHNLTDEPYKIPKNVGLIWLEFTKTTSDPTKAAESIGRRPLGSNEFWDIADFLSKASKQLCLSVPAIPLRSSLPEMLVDATREASEAVESAEIARSEAEEAKAAAKTVRNWGIAAALGVFIGLATLWTTFYMETRDYAEEVAPLSASLSSLQNDLDALKLEVDRFRSDYEQQLHRLDAALEALLDQSSSLKRQFQVFERTQR